MNHSPKIGARPMLVACCALLLSNFAQAENAVYPIEVTRNGKLYQQVAAAFWEGEYPSPVIDINSKNRSGKTSVKVYDSLRNPSAARACTIKNGLYHPWSKTKNSTLNFYTIDSLQSYRLHTNLKADQANELGFQDVGALKSGDEIRYVVYAGEGFSYGLLFHPSSTLENATELTFSSDVFEQHPELFERVQFANTVDKNAEQWLHLRCNEGYDGFVRDSDLLKQRGVREGEITGYGDIAAAK